MKIHSRSLTLLFSVFLICSVAGCETKTEVTSGNEIGDYLSEHPELVEAAEQAGKELNEESKTR
ncbi:hypothetical protein [Rhodopirellula sallentina]|uniref:Secreted protein n=1 Tax=Rhodopirellula sallentina SM41 TaxID=1263870 RepID=M5U290_9BACT|nr:hypothetical protein [Rhodopirellula sallentina]EMI55555.1 secreted protein [Rhodopirellula sallentina SM41]